MTRETLLMVLKLLAEMEAAVEASDSDAAAAAALAEFEPLLRALRTDGPWPARRLP